jgi:hypothetical protein
VAQQSSAPSHARLLGLILFSIGAPMLVGSFLISRDIKPDLSDGQPRAQSPDDMAIPAGWPSLRAEQNAPPENGAIVKMLGYMMDGYHFARNGSAVNMFVLMPAAGHLLHPAHRIPDEMVEVWPEGAVVFKNREMVWVTGKFEHLANSKEEHALYALRDASVAPASQADLAGWFGR